ncbi:MAG: flagellar hook-basal body complex protein [Alphaproteobacteria bacterium]|nr:flagellar hook-basal body complex protein [Alphaproteobacteria bacterium]
MSIFGSLFTAVSGLSAQSDAIGMISNNIANVSTVGYKRIDTAFSSLVTTDSATAAYSPGSVSSSQVATVSQQGILQQTSSPTDVAISGNGFFVVKSSTTDPLAATEYTRAGSFSENSAGDLVNTAGYYLYGWPLDANGAIPANSSNISSLVPVNVGSLGGLTQPTSTASVDLNLNSSATDVAYPVAQGTSPSYSTAVEVYDSLGTGHNLTVNFTKMATPTASITGTTGLASVSGNMAGQVTGLNSTDSFTITTTGTYAGTTTIDTNGTVSQMLAQINAIKDPTTGQPLLYAQLDPTTGGLNIAMRNVGDTFSLANVTGTPLTALGLQGQLQSQALGALNVSTFSQTDLTTAPSNIPNTDAFTVQVGANPAVTVNVNAGMTKLLSDLNAITGVSASVDSATGFLDIRSTNNSTITLADLGTGDGTPLQDLGITPGAFTVTGKVPAPSQSPNLLTPLNAADNNNTNGWWNVSFTTPSGAVVSSGAINFTGSGQLNAVPDSNQKVLTALNNIDWGNGSNPQSINFDMSGFTQFASGYNVVSSTQNGAALGLQTGVSIDSNGYVVAQFSNGQSQKIYQLPLATFSNPDGLNSGTGNVFSQTDASGTYNLRQSNTGGAGTISSDTLEASNVDLATEFANMIVTQQAYAANSKVITTADQMTQALLQIQA